MAYGVGVDLGTTWTAAAVVRAGGEPQIVALGGRSAAVPTVVALEPDGTFVVGDAALRRAATEPERAARAFKRAVGDTAPVLVGGQPWPAEALLVTVLRWVLDRVAEQEGGPPGAVAVTHPANWGPLRRELLEQAITHAGIPATLLTEPEAAAIHYASAERVPDGAVVAVYDLGGGTFDATVLRKAGAGFDVLGRPEGVERLGGLDVDAAVLGHVTTLLGPAWTGLDAGDPATRVAAARVRDDCVAAKEALSEDTAVTIPVQLPALTTEVRLTRGELEQMVRPLVDRSADALDRAIAGAGLTAAGVDRILLAGGSSRIPLVSQILTERFGRPLALDAHPKHAVALGAARVATPVAAAPPPPPTPPPPPQPSGRRRGPLLAGAAVVALVAIVAGFFALRGGDDGGREDDGGDGDDPIEVADTSEPVSGESLRVTVLSGDDRVADARIVVTDTDGVELAVGETDAEGQVSFPLADLGADEVVVSLDLDSIPEGLAPIARDSVTVELGRSRNVLFRVEPGEEEPEDEELDETALAGAWFFEGAAAECVGLDEASCADFRESFTSNLVVDCPGRNVCTIAIGESAPRPLVPPDLDDALFAASGLLAPTDGFQCDGAPDPTAWAIEMTRFDADTFDATITLESQEGAVDGNACVFERVVAAGTAARR